MSCQRLVVLLDAYVPSSRVASLWSDALRRAIVATMEIDFRHDGDQGRVTVTCVPNDDPAAVGKGEEARGFPACSATIAYPGSGYRAVFGWVQLVCSTDNAFEGRAFEMDPLRFFEDSPAPYCWYGITPVLFDAPSRDERRPLEWLAHSFLAVTPREPGAAKRVVPLLGFFWGFAIGDEGTSCSGRSSNSGPATGTTTFRICASATRAGSSPSGAEIVFKSACGRNSVHRHVRSLAEMTLT